MNDLGKGRYLGSLCMRGHEFESSGKSARSPSGHCIECDRMRHYVRHHAGVVRPRKAPIGTIFGRARINELARRSYALNRERISAQKKLRRLERIDEARRKEREDKAKLRANGGMKEYARGYYKRNAIKVRLRNRIFRAMKVYSSSGKVYRTKQYGIDIPAIIQHLGPCPGRPADWHIDHIRPLATFDFDDLDQIKQAFSPENHQWLPAFDNRLKGARWIG